MDTFGDMPFPVGHMIANRYEILEVLKAGIQGEVYRVHDDHDASECVLKLLDPHLLPGGTWDEAQYLRTQICTWASRTSLLRSPRAGH
jgi:hypothetical protein